MKHLKAVLLIVVGVAGMVGYDHFAPSVHAQISTPALTCPQGYVCGQYVVQVAVQRGFGRWTVYQVGTDQVIDTTQFQVVGSGNPSTSVQFFEPAPRDTVMATITATE